MGVATLRALAATVTGMARKSDKLRAIIREELEALLSDDDETEETDEAGDEEASDESQSDDAEGDEAGDDKPLTRADMKAMLAEMLEGREAPAEDAKPASKGKPASKPSRPAGFTPGRKAPTERKPADLKAVAKGDDDSAFFEQAAATIYADA